MVYTILDWCAPCLEPGHDPADCEGLRAIRWCECSCGCAWWWLPPQQRQPKDP